MNAPLPQGNYPEIPDSSTLPATRAENAQVRTLQEVIYIDLDFLDTHKIATDPRFVVRDGLNERRW